MRQRLPSHLRAVAIACTIALGACASTTRAPELPAVPQPAPAPVPLPPAPTSEKVTMAADLFFDHQSSKLKPEGIARLETMVGRTAGLDLEVIIVIGHVDGEEARDSATSRRLSTARAEAVKTYLVGAGLDSARMYAEGRGDVYPVANNATAEGRAKNRRAEVELVAFPGSARAAPLPRGLVPVLFATTRAATGSSDPAAAFGASEATGPPETRLTLGRVLVRVPPNRQRGTIKEPGYVSIVIEKMSRSTIAEFIGLSPRTAGDPLTDFMFAGPIERLTRDSFRTSLDAAISRSRSKSALVYVHGFANSFKDAVFRTAQFSYDLADERFDVVPILFSWPADAQHVNYLAATDALWPASKQLARFLDQLADDAGIGVVHLVAHSKGAQVLTMALDELRTGNLLAMTPDGPPLVPRFNQIVLAAPDIRASDFGALILPAVASRHRVTSYVASNDRALRLSKAGNAVARAGDAGAGLVLVDGVETIDVTAVNGGGLGHSGFGDSPVVMADIRQQLSGIVPSARGLRREQRADSRYWVLTGCIAGPGTRCER